MSREKVVILAGGQGMRLREETEFRPKPMITIGDRPILWHIMKSYAHHGLRDFIVCLGYRGEVIKQYFLDYRAMSRDFTLDLGKGGAITLHESPAAEEEDFRVTLAETGQRAMTGARIKRIEKYVDTDTFCVTYGDGVSNVDIGRLIAFHREHGRIGTVTGVFPQSRFGELLRDGSRVVEFNEKPLMHDGCINGGFFVFSRKFFDYLEDDDGCVLEGKPLARLAKDGELMVYEHRGFWQCMDTMRDLEMLRSLWTGGAPWKVW
ncbi:glucose-1-phosphate cytidylyltransferase [Polyangium sorediatum]|uniref:Glucose-1-phosphate cytidylyltransferase n=1 Tax=Polyangium sorediatum TaxID=889274 RepID=A0ABT6P0S9_9BACT|nr:glucose-1-phosphate cytidylyltransferase [Polyangium sorediatum]MDI1434205.1 glucose-1-phosphate cytidylyltransferase [Polyangium sorediatum]